MDKRMSISLVGIAALAILFLGTQVAGLNGQLSREKEYSTELNRIDEELFDINSKGLTASSDAGTCGVRQDTACLTRISEEVTQLTAEFNQKTTERNSLKDKYGK